MMVLFAARLRDHLNLTDCTDSTDWLAAGWLAHVYSILGCAADWQMD